MYFFSLYVMVGAIYIEEDKRVMDILSLASTIILIFKSSVINHYSKPKYFNEKNYSFIVNIYYLSEFKIFIIC